MAHLNKDYEGAVTYIREGVEVDPDGTKDGIIYTTWGEALQRLGQDVEAQRVFQRGADYHLYPSALQRSMYNVNNLEAKPFWTVKETGVKTKLETIKQNWHLIRDEAMKLLSGDGHFGDESEQLLDVGDWKQFMLFARGQKETDNCHKAPLTCKIIEMFPEARFCKRGQVKFSVLQPGTHIWPHCGPTNCRLRAHLGLIVPPDTEIRVGTETRTWREGEWLIFDDSFEHEVRHLGSAFRLVLIVDVWHPDLNEYQRKNLSPI